MLKHPWRHPTRSLRSGCRWQIVWLLAIVSSMWANTAGAIEPSVAQEAMILLKVLSYARQLEHGAAAVEIVVLDGPGLRSEQRVCEEWGDAITLAASQISLHERPIAIRRQSWVDGKSLEAELVGHPADALLVCEHIGDNARTITDIARNQRVLTMTRRRDLAASSFAVGIVRDGSRVEIVVNLPAATAQGATFGSELLQLATVVR